MLKSKIIKNLTLLAFILLGVTGGLVYANYNGYEFTTQNSEKFPDNLSQEIGEYGVYKAIYDQEKERWTIGLWQDTLIQSGNRDISQLQTEGGVITFEMPWNGEIYNIGGEIYVNNRLWDNGNPALNSQTQSEIKKGSNVEIRYGKENQSAGFQIWFN